MNAFTRSSYEVLSGMEKESPYLQRKRHNFNCINIYIERGLYLFFRKFNRYFRGVGF